jgi:hypothetical protein
VIQNKEGGALHVNRSDGSIRLPDAAKLDRGDLFENITGQRQSKGELSERIKKISPLPERPRQAFCGGLALD